MIRGQIRGERTDEAYWTARWERDAAPPPPIDADDAGLDNFVPRQWDRYFRDVLADLPPGSRLLEIGCAQSRWLPYFHTRLGLSVSGLDYSPTGCAKARAVLDAAGVAGEIVCGDMFDPPPAMRGRFDVVVSFGVMEHFDHTAAAIAAAARLVRPGGRMVTTIPNMRGSTGFLQRWLDPEVYATHVPLRPDELAAAHEEVGLEVVRCAYVMPANWGIVATDQRSRDRADRWIRTTLKSASRLVWLLERHRLAPPPNRLTSPYIACLARRPG